MLLPLCRIDGLCQAPIKKYEFLVANIDAGVNILKAISANTYKLLKLRVIDYYYYFMPIGYSIRYEGNAGSDPSATIAAYGMGWRPKRCRPLMIMPAPLKR